MLERNVERKVRVYSGVPDKFKRLYMATVPLTMDTNAVEVAAASVRSSYQFEVS